MSFPSMAGANCPLRLCDVRFGNTASVHGNFARDSGDFVCSHA
jgi:hypothetical protein